MRKSRKLIALFLFLVLIFFIFFYKKTLDDEMQFEYSVWSPQKIYRVDFYYSGSFEIDKENPTVARLYDNKTNVLLQQSKVFDASGGAKVDWWIKGFENPSVTIGGTIEQWPIPLEKSE